jgi:hypothetical protein
MPAKSEAQQRFMGMALAAKRGKGRFSKKVMEAAENMSQKQLRDFAVTKHKGLPEKKAYLEGFMKRAADYGYSESEISEAVKIAEGYVPSPQEQNTVLNNYVKPTTRDPLIFLKDLTTKKLAPTVLGVEKFLGTTTPARVLAGVYGKNLGGEVGKANQYNAKYNYPLIGPSVLNDSSVYSAKGNFTAPHFRMTGISKNPDLFSHVSDTQPDLLTTNSIVNGFQPIKPGVNINNPSFDTLPFNKFISTPVRPIMPMQHVMEHEVAGHRVYKDSEKERLPEPLEWPSPATVQPYQNNRGEALNGLAAIQRDQFQNTGKRYETPAHFKGDLNRVLNSPDIEKSIDTQGWGRPDAKRLIRSLVPMLPEKRKEFIDQAAKTIPGMVRTNTPTAVKTGSYYHSGPDLTSGENSLKNYFNSEEFNNPDTSNVPDPAYDPNAQVVPEAIEEGLFDTPHPVLNAALKAVLRGALIGVPAYYIGKSFDKHKEKPQAKTAGMLSKIKEYMKKHEDKPSESLLKGFVKKQKEGLPALLKMQRLDRMREIGRQMDERSKK